MVESFLLRRTARTNGRTNCVRNDLAASAEPASGAGAADVAQQLGLARIDGAAGNFLNQLDAVQRQSYGQTVGGATYTVAAIPSRRNDSKRGETSPDSEAKRTGSGSPLL